MIVRIFSDYLCPWCYVAAVRLHHLQEEYKERITMQWRSFLLFREDAHKGWNGYVAAHWHKAQEAEPTLTFTPWRDGTYPATTLPAHIAGKAMAHQGRFDAFHLEAMRAFFSLNQNLEDPAALRQVAASVGADLDRFDQDVADSELKERVWREFTTGVERDRITAIPTLFAGERRVVEGALSLDRYRQLFDAVLAETERSV